MSKISPDQIVRASVKLEEQCALSSSFPFRGGVFSFSETTFIYGQPESLNSRHVGLDSNALQVRSEEFHRNT